MKNLFHYSFDTWTGRFFKKKEIKAQPQTPRMDPPAAEPQTPRSGPPPTPKEANPHAAAQSPPGPICFYGEFSFFVFIFVLFTNTLTPRAFILFLNFKIGKFWSIIFGLVFLSLTNIDSFLYFSIFVVVHPFFSYATASASASPGQTSYGLNSIRNDF